ncbi:MAG: hypothetical protein QXP34_01855 [Candidatus Aenigmatarchaeota archaeon]
MLGKLARRLKGAVDWTSLLTAAVFMVVVGVVLVMGAYITKTFQTGLNTTDPLITSIFDSVLGVYNLFSAFLGPIGVVVIFVIIIVAVIFAVAYIRGAISTSGG